MIQVESVEKTYRRLGRPGKRALEGIDLEIGPREVFGLIGPNGAGKTTLLTCILGFIRPDRGRIRVDGHEPDDLSVRARTGYLPERLGFDRELTGRQFLNTHARLARIPRDRVAAAVDEGIARAELPREAMGRTLKTYSRGMLQRIGLAQALFGDPDLLFLDEPASGMDPVGVALVRRHVLEAKARGATVVLNSHQLPEVERVCDRVAFIAGGRLERLEVLQADRGGCLSWAVRVASGQEPRAAAALQAAGLPVALHGDRLRVQGDVDGIAPALVAAGVALRGLEPWSVNLEDLFSQERRGA